MSLQNLATQMAAQGRGPDRTLVHMSPKEVQGLQALAMAHGGSLTINPETGLPEAGFLESILPAVAGFALNAFAPGVGTAVGGMFGLGEAAGTALTVGGIAGLASGSLEKGIMAGMGAYGGAGLAGSLMNSGTSALTQAGVDAAGGAAALGGDASGIAQKVSDASTFDKLKSGFSAAASTPKDFLSDNKFAIGAALLPAIAGGLNDKGEGTGAPKTPKYIRRYETDPVTGEIRQAQAVSTDDFGDQSAVSFGGVRTRGMADGGPVSFGGVSASTKVIDPYDTRTDSQKAMAYLMGEANATNPMLFTHKQASGPIEPADMTTRTGGHYVLDASTNNYVWVPDAAAPAAGLPALVNAGGGGGGGGGPRDPADQDRINNLFDSYASQDKVFGLPPGTTASEARSKDLASAAKFIMSPLSSIYSFAKDAFMGPQPKSMAEVMAGLKEAKHDESEGDMNTDTSPTVSTPLGDAPLSGAPSGGSVARDGSSFGGTGSSVSRDGPNGPEGRGDPGGDRGGWGRGGGYAQGGIASLAGGGLGSLGGYSDGGQLLRGPGDGVSDSIPARIAGNQPARLANNEFVIPARIVSEIGNGSTDAGARELYKMMARVQAGRKKSIGKGKIAVDSKAVKHLPA